MRFHRLTPITGARTMAGGDEETYKHTLTWNQKWGGNSFKVAAELKSSGLACLWIAHLSVECSEGYIDHINATEDSFHNQYTYITKHVPYIMIY